MIYLDNAATGGFKPSQAIEAAFFAMKYLNANAGRSGHRLAITCADEVYETRKTLARIFSAKIERVIFTANCTAALNQAIYGLATSGSNVVTTVTEHNSVLRPLYDLEKRGEITLTVVAPETGGVTADDIANALTDETRLVVVNAVSNVTGASNDVYAIGEMLEKRNINYIVDGAQAGGHIPLDVQKLKCDALCLAGHKGLYSIQGAGALILGNRTVIKPLLRGGTGIDSFNPDMPDDLPDRLEAGTLALPAIRSLKEGAAYACGALSYTAGQLTALTDRLISELSDRPYLTVYSLPNPCGIVAFKHKEIPSQEVADLLSERYDIAVRGGYHCAPLMHKFLGTEKFGLVRVSASPMNTRREIKALISALDEITLS